MRAADAIPTVQAKNRLLRGSKKDGYTLRPDVLSELPVGLGAVVKPYEYRSSNTGRITGWRWHVVLCSCEGDPCSRLTSHTWWDFEKHEDLEGVGYTRDDLEVQVKEGLLTALLQWRYDKEEA